MASEAQNLIVELNAKGMNNSQIAKQLGRDSSYISQIRAGKRTGTAYVEGLQALNNNQTTPPIERRKTKEGSVAKVRTSPHIKNDQKQTIAYTTKTPNGPQMMKVLQNVAKSDGRIGVSVELRQFQAYGASKPTSGTTTLWTKWYSAQSVLDKMKNEKLTFSELIEQQVGDRSNVEVAQGVKGVTVNVDYTPRKEYPVNRYFSNRNEEEE